MPKNPRAFAIATAQVKKSHEDCRREGAFKAGTRCDQLRKTVAEGVGRSLRRNRS